MIERKDAGNWSVSQSIDAATITGNATATNGTAIDLLDYDGALIIVNVGETGETLSGSLYIELEVEHSDDNSTFVDCTDSEITNTVTGNNTGTFGKIDANTEDDAVFSTAYLGRKRYVRPVVQLTGNHTTGTPIGANVVRFRKRL